MGRRWFHSPKYTVDVGAHTFPTVKFQRTAESLVAKGLLQEKDRVEPTLPSRDELKLVHTDEWCTRVLDGTMTLDDELRAELPWSRALSDAHALAVSGTLLAAREALATGLGVHVGGGAHHAFAAYGEGFCLLNDLAVAAAKLRAEGAVKRVLICDLDVHQGNGTASIFKKNLDVFTFSMHQEEGYPKIRERSSLDVELPAGTRDREYQDALTDRLPGALDAHRPDLVLYQAGADVHERDLLGGLKLTDKGVAARDRFVFEACLRRAIPIALTLGGGYSPKIEDTIALHAGTVKEALSVFR
ncbi:MAG: histone deacetylase [Elusimicrobia bacterium]|nr:histone deacetylase [Elusimicrobiota bacterium]